MRGKRGSGENEGREEQRVGIEKERRGAGRE